MEKIQAHMILEILGRPKEYIRESLNNLIKVKLANEKGVKIIEQEVHESVPVKDSDDLFTTFAELTIEFESLEHYIEIMFRYMPANMEIIYPEKIILKNEDLNVLANRLTQRLHDYDAIVKNSMMEKEIYANKLKEIAPHLFEQPQVSPVVQEKSEKNVKNTKSSKKKIKKR